MADKVLLLQIVKNKFTGVEWEVTEAVYKNLFKDDFEIVKPWYDPAKKPAEVVKPPPAPPTK